VSSPPPPRSSPTSSSSPGRWWCSTGCPRRRSATSRAPARSSSRTATLAPGLVDQRAAARRALGEAALVNLLSPHPWIFWATVLGPLLLTSWRDGPVGAVAMVVGFYVTLVGAKAVVAVLVARGRHRIGDRGYRRALLAAGFLLLLAAVLLAVEFVPVAFS
jgi:threonine/homoserine/homoserine lactone efflux protein